MTTSYAKTIVTLRDGKEMPLADLLGPLPDELKPLAEKLKTGFRKLTQETARGYYAIGQLLRREIAKIEADGRSTYGFKVYQHLGVEVDIHPRILRNCVRVAESFEPEEFKAQIVDRGLTWGHASLLTRTVDGTQRQKLIDRTVAEKLSVLELDHLITGETPKKPRGPGRSPAKPRDLPHALERLRRESKGYHNSFTSVLFGEKFDIVNEILTAPPDTFTQQIRDTAAECAEQLYTIQESVREASNRLEDALERIDKCMSAQAKHDEKEQKGPRGRLHPVGAQ